MVDHMALENNDQLGEVRKVEQDRREVNVGNEVVRYTPQEAGAVVEYGQAANLHLLDLEVEGSLPQAGSI